VIKFSCACGKNLKVTDESSGKKVKCPGCDKVVVVPATVVAGGIDQGTAALSSPDLQKPLGDLPTDPATSALNPTVAPAGSALRQDTHVIDHADPPKAEAAGLTWSLGGYRILRQLGEGGMGAVYEAEDIKLERRVALKVMKPEIAENQQNRERFLREACTAASVESDFICPIFEVGEDNGVPFIAMPFLKGEPLNKHWRKGTRLAIDEVVRIGKEVAEGLSAAHEAGLVHRDIKPANIWLETQRSGTPRAVILDFGLARKQVEDVHLTQSGAILGTPAYMSPEQARGDTHVDARTDLFSLGSVLYALCTGEMPFKGETTMGILTALATKNPSSPAKISPTPKPLSSLIMRLLAKNPDDRPQTAREVIEKLAEIERDRANKAIEEPTAQFKPPTDSDTTILHVPKNAEKATAKTQQLPPEIPGAPTPKSAYALVTLIALGLLGCIVTLLGGGVYYIVTDKGTIEIRTEDENVQVLLLKNGQEIEILDGVSKKTWAIRTGTYTVRLKDDPDGLEIVMPDTFEMKRGGKQVVTIRKKGPNQVLVTNHALQFDGMTSYVEIPTLRRDDLGPVTIEAWVNAEPPVSASAILMLGGKASCCLSASELNWSRTPGSGATFFTTDRTLDRPFVERPLKQGLVHLAYVADAKEGRLYLDGELVDRGARTKGPEGTYDTHAWLGAHPEGDAILYHFRGVISQARVSKTARYDKNFTPAKRFVPDKDTLALYLFNEGQGDKLADTSGNNHHGKIVGAKWVKVDSATTWGQIVDPLGDCRIAEVNRRLSITVPGGRTHDLNPLPTCNMNAPRVLKEVHGDFEARVMVRPLAEEAKAKMEPDYVGAGLVLWQDEGQILLRHSRQLGNRPGIGTEWWTGRKLLGTDYVPGIKNAPVHLRLRRAGDTVHLAWSLDGQKWNECGAATDLKLSPRVRVGVSAVNGAFQEYTAEFEGFTIVPVTPPPAVAPFDAIQAKKHQEAWANHLGVPVEYTNSLGMKFRLIPPGTFTMGSSKEEIDRCLKLNAEIYKGDDAIWHRDRIISEGPAHDVEITQPFYLGATHVTVGQYRQFVDKQNYRPEDRRWEKPGWEQTDEHPVVFTAWKEADEFCRWLGTKEGQHYRLPTEAEWEYSCRAGTTTRYWFGDNEDDVLKHDWIKPNAKSKTHPVKQFDANPFGLYDMHGNAAQWCQDLHDEGFYKKSPRKDPVGDGDGRLIRGGTWDHLALYARSAFRNSASLDPDQQRGTVNGFRAALTVDAVKQALRSPAATPLLAFAPFAAAQAKKYQEAWAKHLGAPVETTNKIGMKMVLIPPPGEELPKPYYLGKFEVTQAEWEQVMDYNPSKFGSKNPKMAGQDARKFPVEQVNWFECVEFCNKLSEREGLKPYYELTVTSRVNGDGKQIEKADVKIFGGNGYHLPTGAEWEHACRAGTNTKYHSGDNDVELKEYAWSVENSDDRTHAIGEKRPNGFGLYDMHGNVREWTEDVSLDKPGGSERVLRGGAYLHPAFFCASFYRYGFAPGGHYPDFGLRVARTPSASETSASKGPDQK
jgi:formylglycine-generating enzyme required for sulfatase activity/serine/threonine protein kinase